MSVLSESSALHSANSSSPEVRAMTEHRLIATVVVIERLRVPISCDEVCGSTAVRGDEMRWKVKWYKKQIILPVKSIPRSLSVHSGIVRV